mgnify:CR=1 FL=1
MITIVLIIYQIEARADLFLPISSLLEYIKRQLAVFYFLSLTLFCLTSNLNVVT